MSSKTLFIIYCLAAAAVSLLHLALQSWAKEDYDSSYKRFLDRLDWFFLGGALFYCITVWPW